MSVGNLLTELKTAYANAGLDCGDGLYPPATLDSLRTAEGHLGMPLPQELKSVFLVHGGQTYIAPGVTGLFGMHRLHSPQELIEHHRMYMTHCVLEPLPDFPPKDGDVGCWNPKLIPFASWDAYDLCIHSENGNVWEFCPNIGLTNHKVSISAIIRELLSELKAGAAPKLRTDR